MKSRTIYILLGLLILVVAGGVFLLIPRNRYSRQIVNSEQEDLVTADNTTEATETVPQTSYAMAEVKSHADANSCWSAIRGNIYDITTLVDEHKGGREEVLKLCGTDGTDAYVKKHGAAEKPEALLDTFKIGALLAS